MLTSLDLVEIIRAPCKKAQCQARVTLTELGRNKDDLLLLTHTTEATSATEYVKRGPDAAEQIQRWMEDQHGSITA